MLRNKFWKLFEVLIKRAIEAICGEFREMSVSNGWKMAIRFFIALPLCRPRDPQSCSLPTNYNIWLRKFSWCIDDFIFCCYSSSWLNHPNIKVRLARIGSAVKSARIFYYLKDTDAQGVTFRADPFYTNTWTLVQQPFTSNAYITRGEAKALI